MLMLPAQGPTGRTIALEGPAGLGARLKGEETHRGRTGSRNPRSSSQTLGSGHHSGTGGAGRRTCGSGPGRSRGLSTGLREQGEVCARRTSRGRWVTASSPPLALLALRLLDLSGEGKQTSFTSPHPLQSGSPF